MRISFHTIAATLVLSAGFVVSSTAGAAQSLETATYTTAKVVSIDTHNRMLVIRGSDGKAQTAKLDDTVAGFPVGIQPGDQVIVSLRKEPGMPRVSSIVKSAPPSAANAPRPVRPTTASQTEATPGPVVLLGADSAAGRGFDERVATIALDANRVDGLWSAFRNSCDAKLTGSFGGSREWTSLWTNQAKADLSSGFCRDLFNQIVGLGDTVSKAMAGAEEGVRETLLPGAIREIRVRHSMDFSGWGSPAPERQKP
jgi:hypothetical protein